MRTPKTRGLVLPRLLYVLGGAALLALGIASAARISRSCHRPCDRRVFDSPVIKPVASAVAITPTVEPTEPAKPMKPVLARVQSAGDLVGLYRGQNGCVLRIDTLGEISGCDLDGSVALEDWRPTPTGIVLALDGQPNRTFELVNADATRTTR